MTLSPRARRLVRIGSILLLLFVITTFVCDWIVTNNAAGRTFSDPLQTPHVRVGLLLGTSRTTNSGYSNPYFQYRIEAAIALFKNNVIRDLIISGDNSHIDYDEPSDMRAELLKAGIDSSHIFLDYAGFRTFDSVVRAHEIFGQDSFIVISQQFHNERAITIAQMRGLTAIGFNAADVSSKYGLQTMVREKFSRLRTFLDVALGTRPHFGGPRIEIPQ